VEIRARDRGERLASFLRTDLWREELEPRSWTTRGMSLLQFAVMVGQGFVRDRLLLRASALTYFTVLSIVPLLAIVSSVLTAVGVTENVVSPIIAQIAAASPEMQAKILEFVENANIRRLGTVGAAALFLTSILAVTNIEKALNDIWGVKQTRPLMRRVPDYMAVLFVAPLLLGAALSLGASLKSQWLVQRLLEVRGFAELYRFGLRGLPVAVMAVAFAFLYWFLPNTRVRPLAALLGGLVAAVLVNGALAVYVGFSIGAARADALYGAFAQVPLLFVWIYFFWAIVLFGAEIAFAQQSLPLYRREVRGERAGPAEQAAIGLRIAVEIGRAFRDEAPAWSADHLSDALRVPVRTVRLVLQSLQAAHLVAQLEDGSFQLGRPAERIHVVDVLAALRGPREPARGDAALVAAVESVLAQLAEGEAKASAGQTLADVLASVPPLAPAR
jgi:membrane protein